MEATRFSQAGSGSAWRRSPAGDVRGGRQGGNYPFEVLHVGSAGPLDATFNGTGVVRTIVGVGGSDARAVAIDACGRAAQVDLVPNGNITHTDERMPPTAALGLKRRRWAF